MRDVVMEVSGEIVLELNDPSVRRYIAKSALAKLLAERTPIIGPMWCLVHLYMCMK